MAKIISILIFFLIILSISSYAQPPQQFSTAQDQLEIEFPKFENYQLRDNLLFNFHVFNSSGAILTNSSVVCLFDLFNLSGHHILNDDISSSDVDDFENNVSGILFNKVGHYSYVLHCNNTQTGKGGFTSVSFGIVDNLKKALFPGQEGNNMLSIILSQLIIIAFFVFFGLIALKLNIDDRATNPANQNRLSFWVMFVSWATALIEIVFTAGVLFVNESVQDLTALLLINFYILLILMFGIIMSVGIIIVMRMLTPDRDNEKWENDIDSWK